MPISACPSSTNLQNGVPWQLGRVINWTKPLFNKKIIEYKIRKYSNYLFAFMLWVLTCVEMDTRSSSQKLAPQTLTTALLAGARLCRTCNMVCSHPAMDAPRMITRVSHLRCKCSQCQPVLQGKMNMQTTSLALPTFNPW